jgi:Serine dehydrogenase proteinase
MMPPSSGIANAAVATTRARNASRGTRSTASSEGSGTATGSDPEQPDDPLAPPPQTPLFHGLEQARYHRQSQIRAIQSRTGRRLIAYVAAPYTSISSFDIPPFVDLLHDVGHGDSLDLLLQTPGGEVDQAERIILMCRKRVKGEFRVIVPDSAKSAGTLIAIAADEIVMGEPSELGPIDPQVEITTASGEAMSRPAQSFLDGLARIVAEADEEDEISPAYFPLLDKLDPALIDFCEKALQYSKVLAARLLKQYMLKDDHTKADEIAADLVNVKKYLSHAAVIDSERALALGLNVRFLPHDDLLWQALWRLYIDMRLTWDAPNRRLFEGQKASLLV